MVALVLKIPATEQVYVNGVLLEVLDKNATIAVLSKDANIMRVRDMVPDELRDRSKVHLAAWHCGRLAAGLDSWSYVTSDIMASAVNELEQSSETSGIADQVQKHIDRAEYYQAVQALRKAISR